MRVYINFPYLSGTDNSMGVFVRDLAASLVGSDYEPIVCSIRSSNLPHRQINIGASIIDVPGRIKTLCLYRAMRHDMSGKPPALILNVSHEFIFPCYPNISTLARPAHIAPKMELIAKRIGDIRSYKKMLDRLASDR